MTSPSRPAPEAARAAIDALLAPLTLSEWLDRYWGRECFVHTGGRDVVPPGLPTEADFERLLASLTSPSDGWFSLVRGRARPPDESMLSSEGWVSLPEVFEAYGEGHSLLLNQVQKRHEGVGCLCRNLEAVLTGCGVLLSRHVGANLYLSPPNSQGFGIHYDPHDVLVLQIEGVKHWSLYRTRLTNAMEAPAEPFTLDQAGGVACSYTMEPGDLAYIPRGVLHAARSSERASLHLTLSIEPATWRDFFAEAMRKSSDLREALPIGFAIGGSLSAADREAMAVKAALLPLGAAVEEAALSVWSRLLLQLDRMPGTGPSLRAHQCGIGVDTSLCLAEGIFGKVAQDPDQATLHLPGISLQAPLGMAPTFEYLLTQPWFTARQLPTDRSPEQVLPLLQQLLAGGFLKLASTNPP